MLSNLSLTLTDYFFNHLLLNLLGLQVSILVRNQGWLRLRMVVLWMRHYPSWSCIGLLDLLLL